MKEKLMEINRKLSAEEIHELAMKPIQIPVFHNRTIRGPFNIYKISELVSPNKAEDPIFDIR